jgi:hypothetical protein
MRVLKSLLKPLAALIVVAALLAAGGLAYYGAPLTDAPGVGTRLARYLTGAPVQTARYSAYPELRMKDFPRPREEVFEAAVSAVNALGWEISAVSSEGFRLQARAAYPIPEIKGRITVEVRQTEDGLSALFVRSDTSGPWPDFGSNTKRIMELHDKIEAIL